MVQAKRRTSSQAGRRRSHHALGSITLNTCSKCGKAAKPHMACPFCGTYKGREILKLKTKKTKSA